MKNKQLIPSQQGRLEFWTRFNDVMAERNEFNVRKATTDHWLRITTKRNILIIVLIRSILRLL